MKKTITVLSIDFDYFVEENPVLDWGHREQVFFLETIWNIRAHGLAAQGKTLEQAAPFSGDPISLLFQVLIKGTFEYSLAVAESHAAIVPWLHESFPGARFEIVNIDAHHDLYYDGDPAGNPMGPEYECGSWGRYLINRKLVKSWKQVYPKWRRKFPEETGPIFAWARKHTKFTVGEYLPRLKPDAIFLCRSGCWTPPCYDSKFTEMVQLLKGQPLKERALKINQDAVEKERQFREICSRISLTSLSPMRTIGHIEALAKGRRNRMKHYTLSIEYTNNPKPITVTLCYGRGYPSIGSVEEEFHGKALPPLLRTAMDCIAEVEGEK